MKKRRLFVIVLSIPLFFFLLFGGIVVYYLFANPITAQVSIQPSAQHMQNFATLAVVTDHPDPIQHQVAAARQLSTTATQTMRQTATGHGHTGAATASGMVEMIGHLQPYDNAYLHAGDTLTGSDGITIVADDSASVGFTSLRHIAYFHAHVVKAGSRGNIPAFGFHTIVYGKTSWGADSAEFYNTAAFTGGQDAGPYTFVQQSDITSGERMLTALAIQSTLSSLLAQATPNEQWVSIPNCTPNATADKASGDRAKDFQVTVTITCSGEVYNAQTLRTVAAQELTTMAQNELSEGYRLAGAITTTIISIGVMNEKQGILSVSLFSRGTWRYQFTNKQEQHLAQLISGKNIAEAQKLLLQEEHIEHVKITIMHSFWLWNALPTDIKKISISQG